MGEIGWRLSEAIKKQERRDVKSPAFLDVGRHGVQTGGTLLGRVIFEIIVYAGDNSDNFLPGGELVAVVDGEVALRGTLDFAEFATGIFGKFFGSFAGVFGGGFNHGGLNLIE